MSAQEIRGFAGKLLELADETEQDETESKFIESEVVDSETLEGLDDLLDED